MNKFRIYRYIAITSIILFVVACGIPKVAVRDADRTVPDSYYGSLDTNNMAKDSWKVFFTDPNLVALIDTALKNNQELNIMRQEINVSNNEILAKKGEYLPFVDVGGAAGVDKVSRFTSQGASDDVTEVAPNVATPEYLGDFMVGAFASWEVDIWRKLRNSRDAAIDRYLASVEGTNFMITNLIAEISNSYYELLALDAKLALIKEYIKIQENALKTVRLQKQAGEVSELAVKRFEAQVFNTKAMQFDVEQQIIETENRINFLLGRYPQPIVRNSTAFTAPLPDTLSVGIPSQLMENRPDIIQAEYMLSASKLDVKVAKAQFYPSFDITAGIGFRAFNPAYIIQAPESMLANLAGDLMAPVINRKAIKADYMNANAKQMQAVYHYEQTVLNAYVEVANQVSKIDNLKKSYEMKAKEVEVLNQSIIIANELFTSAKADYMEVLITQRDALEAQFELVEYKKFQFNTMINLYRSLGGGWR
ncbi:MAG: TolC family protein [Crocinitomicaceae bacterium]